MTSNLEENYKPRSISKHGILQINDIKFKVYGLSVERKSIYDKMLIEAKEFSTDTVFPKILSEGEYNGLGFIIIHPGDRGLSISVHWWIQGSVLCQQIKRQLYNSNTPMDTAKRPAVACVWELAIINEEQIIWRETMMNSEPNREHYLAKFTDLTFA